jgi:hypothetical protein
MRRAGAIVIALAAAVAAAAGALATPTIPTPRQLTESVFDAKNFSDGARIDNPYLPLAPATQMTYQGRATQGGRREAHRIVITVSDLTKVVYGVRTLVVWDQDLDGARLAEQEISFFAQDDDRNIWALGEYPEEYEGGTFAAPSVWIVGQAGARPGLHFPGHPRPGTPAYSQGYAPKIGWGDIARVVSAGQRVCVPTGCYRDVLQTDETNPLERGDGHQRKYYAPGVGNVQVEPGPGDKDREVMHLVSVTRLSPAAMVRVRRHVRALDQRAYRVAKPVYGPLPALQRLQGAP